MPKYLLATLLFCLALTGCRQSEDAPSQAPPAVEMPLPAPSQPESAPSQQEPEQALPESTPQPREPEPSQPDTIDPLEEAARLSAPEPETEIPVQSMWESSETSAPAAVLSEETTPFTDTDPPLAPAPRAERNRARAADAASAEPEFDTAIAAGQAPRSAQTSTLETALLGLINDERAARGLPALGVEESLQFAARIRAQEALESLSHTRPDGSLYHTALDEAGFPYAGKWHGENLAVILLEGSVMDDTVAAQALFDEWKSSPGHEQNMLGENFLQTGIGVYVEENGDAVRIGSAQLFASL